MRFFVGNVVIHVVIHVVIMLCDTVTQCRWRLVYRWTQSCQNCARVCESYCILPHVRASSETVFVDERECFYEVWMRQKLIFPPLVCFYYFFKNGLRWETLQYLSHFSYFTFPNVLQTGVNFKPLKILLQPFLCCYFCFPCFFRNSTSCTREKRARSPFLGPSVALSFVVLLYLQELRVPCKIWCFRHVVQSRPVNCYVPRQLSRCSYSLQAARSGIDQPGSRFNPASYPNRARVIPAVKAAGAWRQLPNTVERSG